MILSKSFTLVTKKAMAEFEAYQQSYIDSNAMVDYSHQFYIDQRRTVREFSDEPIPFEVMQNLIMTASSSPSGAHKQPWTFCLVKTPSIKIKKGMRPRKKNRLTIKSACRKRGKMTLKNWKQSQKSLT